MALVARVAAAATALAVLAVAAALALMRLSGSSEVWVVELVSFTPLGLAAAAAGLGLALALLRSTPRLAVPLAVVAGALLLTHLVWQAPYVLGRAPTADGESLVVATQNFEHGDADALVALVERHHVDILVVTDVSRERLADLMSAGMTQLLPRTGGTDDGSAVFSRFPVRSSERISEGGDSRTVHLEVPGTGRVDVVVLHPTPPYQGTKWAEDWQRILTRLEPGPRDVPTIVAGDLNATLDHEPLQRLCDLGLTDAATATNAGWSPTWPTNGTQRVFGVGVPPLLALDHVLTGGGLVATGFALDSSVGSDHSAVVAVVGRPPGSAH